MCSATVEYKGAGKLSGCAYHSQQLSNPAQDCLAEALSFTHTGSFFGYKAKTLFPLSCPPSLNPFTIIQNAITISCKKIGKLNTSWIVE